MMSNIEEVVKPGFSLEKVIFEEFKLKRTPEPQGEFEMSISPFGTYNPEKKVFQLNLLVDLNDDIGSFELHLNIVGVFNLSDNYEFSIDDNLFLLNAPAILFPYLRSHISSITALSGMDTINLPVMNLTFLGKKLKDSIVIE